MHAARLLLCVNALRTAEIGQTEMKIADAFGHCRRSRAVSAFAHLTHSFSRRSDGTAAVEFAFVFVPFIVLLAAIIQTAFVFFATEALETATADAARLVMTGQTQGWTQDQFKAQVNLQVCPPGQLTGLFDCNKLYVDVQKKDSFSAMDSSLPPVVNGKYQTGFDSGSAGSIMLVRLIYQLPVYAFNLPFFDSSINFDLSNVGANHRVIVGTAAFCNEPFTGGTSVTGCSSGSSGT